MNSDLPNSTSGLRARRRQWPVWLTAGLLIAGIFAARSAWKPPPPPPAVNTVGFDPAIAAAITTAREAILSAPKAAGLRGRMGTVLLAHDLRPQAAECFAQAAALAPREPQWVYLLGLAELADHPAAAAMHFDRAVRMFPKEQVLPQLRLADTLLALGRLAEAEAQYRAVIQRDPKSARAQLGLGKIANARGLGPQAAGFLTLAARDPSTRKAAHRLLINVYQRLGRTNEAEQVGRVLPGLPPDPPFPDRFLEEVQQAKVGEAAWLDRGEESIKAGRLAEAAALLEKTVQAYPHSDRALFLLGRARFRLGDPVGAEALLRRATQLAPASVEAHVQLGVLQLAQGHAQEAQRSFRAAIQAKPNLAEAWFNLGLSLGNDNRAESVNAFREAIRLKPSFAEAYLALGVVLRAQGRTQEASDVWHQALKIQPEEPLRQKLLEQLNRNDPSR